MPILSTGTQLGTDVTFNSGTFDINSYELAALQDVTVSLNWSAREIRALGSLVMVVAPKRYGFKPTAKAKVKSVNQELLSFFMGSSAVDATGNAYTVLDGQNVLTRCSIKCMVNESTSQVVEFQFTNAILTGAISLGLKMEDASEYDFEIIAQNVKVVTSFSG